VDIKDGRGLDERPFSGALSSGCFYKHLARAAGVVFSSVTRNGRRSDMAGSPPTDNAQLELRLLGRFELVLRESSELVPAPAAKMRALLAYLAAAPRSTETRRRLAGLLWESSGEDQARQSLRQLLSNFRRGATAKSSGILLFDDTTVSLDLSLVWIDRAALIEVRTDAELAELSRLADLYRDDFGLGLELGEPDFDGWLQSGRIRCRDAAISLFDRLVRALVNLGRHEEALTRAIGWPKSTRRARKPIGS
jgi:DNA-binding SARP family transcriptional activator